MSTVPLSPKPDNDLYCTHELVEGDHFRFVPSMYQHILDVSVSSDTGRGANVQIIYRELTMPTSVKVALWWRKLFRPLRDRVSTVR